MYFSKSKKFSCLPFGHTTAPYNWVGLVLYNFSESVAEYEIKKPSSPAADENTFTYTNTADGTGAYDVETDDSSCKVTVDYSKCFVTFDCKNIMKGSVKINMSGELSGSCFKV